MNNATTDFQSKCLIAIICLSWDVFCLGFVEVSAIAPQEIKVIDHDQFDLILSVVQHVIVSVNISSGLSLMLYKLIFKLIQIYIY